MTEVNEEEKSTTHWVVVGLVSAILIAVILAVESLMLMVILNTLGVAEWLGMEPINFAEGFGLALLLSLVVASVQGSRR